MLTQEQQACPFATRPRENRGASQGLVSLQISPGDRLPGPPKSCDLDPGDETCRACSRRHQESGEVCLRPVQQSVHVDRVSFKGLPNSILAFDSQSAQIHVGCFFTRRMHHVDPLSLATNIVNLIFPDVLRVALNCICLSARIRALLLCQALELLKCPSNQQENQFVGEACNCCDTKRLWLGV